MLEGKLGSVREVLYGVYCGGTKPGMRCVKKGDWKMVMEYQRAPATMEEWDALR